MANTPQAKKRARQAEAHRAHNATQRTMLRGTIKKVRAAIAAKDKGGAQLALRGATAMIDRMVGKGHIHKNTAARHKSRLSQSIKALA